MDWEKSFMQSLKDAIKNGWLSGDGALKNIANPKQLQRAIRGIS